MLTAYGFHIDFQFRDQKSLPRDLQMVLASPWQRTVLASWILDFLAMIFFLGNLYAYAPMCRIMQFLPAPNIFFKKPDYPSS